MTSRVLPLAVLAGLLFGPPVWAQTERDVTAAAERAAALKAANKLDEAEQAYVAGVEAALKVYGEEHKVTAQLFAALGELYERQAKFENAAKAHNRCLRIREKVNGPESPEVAASLSSLGAVAMELSKFEDANKMLGRALAIREKLGPESADTGDALNDLAVLASRRGQFGDAEKLFRRCLAIREKTDGLDSPAVAQALNNLGLVLHDLDRHRDAEDAHRRALAIRERGKTPDQAAVAESLNNLGILLRDMGRLPEAEDLHRKALAVREKVLGPDHVKTAASANNLAVICVDQGKYQDAELLYRRSLAAYERAYGAEHPSVAETVTYMGLLEKARGRLAEADRLFRQALAINEKAYGPDHQAVATSLSHLGTLNIELGRYPEADDQIKRALAIREAVFGKDHMAVASSLTNLANLAAARGRHSDARPLLERVLAIRERAFGKNHPATGEAIANLATVCMQLGEKADAEALYARAVSIYERSVGKSHPAYADAVYSLAGCLFENNKFAEAEAGYKEVLPVFEQALGKDHPHVAETLTKLADSLKAQGKAAAGRDYRQRAWEIMEAAFGPAHPTAATALNNLAVDAFLAGRPEEAVGMYDDQRKASRRFLLRELPYLPEPEQRAFLNLAEVDLLARALTLGKERAKEPDTVRRSAEWLLNGKAVALEARTLKFRLDRETTDPRVRKALVELAELRARENALGSRDGGPGGALIRKQKDEIVARRRELEQQMAGFGGPAANLFRPWVELEDVRRAIPRDGLLIDIALFRPSHLSDKPDEPSWDPARYVAWVIPANGAISIVDLGEAGKIDAAIQTAREAIAAGPKRAQAMGEGKAEAEARAALQKLSDLVVKPVKAHLKGVKHLIISPDGDLWLAPWAALPVDDNQYLVESVNPRLVVTGRDLLPPVGGRKADTSAPLVLADPDFEAVPATPPAVGGRVLTGRLADFAATFVFAPDGKLTIRLPEGEIIGEGSWSQAADVVTMETAVSKYTARVAGRELRGERRFKKEEGAPPEPLVLDLGSGTVRTAMLSLPKAGPLPMTRLDGDAAVERLRGTGASEPKLLTGARATETAVKSAARPRALVLASHGFFLPPPAVLPRGSDDPLGRCGILLAGANRRADQRPGQDDGVLLGLEAIGLDLRGTELVVLTACDTGVGDTTAGDAVGSLRQAFQLAGAQAVVSTLWGVPDAETARLMDRVFERQGTAGRAEVLAAVQREAIQDRRKSNSAAHPFYWASLTLTGRD